MFKNTLLKHCVHNRVRRYQQARGFRMPQESELLLLNRCTLVKNYSNKHYINREYIVILSLYTFTSEVDNL